MTKPMHPNYFSGMTRDQALNYIDHLPGLTDEERNDLIDEAMLRPEGKYVPKPVSGYLKTGQRLDELKKYLQFNPIVTRREIAGLFNVKGTAVDYLIAAAKRKGVLVKLDYWTYQYKEA